MNERREPGLWANVAAVLVNVLALVIINSHPVWRPWTHGVVTDAWSQIVWAANLSAVLQIAGNALLVAFRPPLLQRALRVAFSGGALVAAIVFYVRYPLDFSRLGVGWLDTVAHVLLFLGVLGAALAVVVDLLRFAFPRPRGPRAAPLGGSV